MQKIICPETYKPCMNGRCTLAFCYAATFRKEAEAERMSSAQPVVGIIERLMERLQKENPQIDYKKRSRKKKFKRWDDC